MSRKCFTAEQIIGLLREKDVKLSLGMNVVQVSRDMAITEQTYYRWRKDYGGMKTVQVRRLKDLEPSFVPATQTEIPANPLDPMNTYDDAVIGKIPLQTLRTT